MFNTLLQRVSVIIGVVFVGCIVSRIRRCSAERTGQTVHNLLSLSLSLSLSPVSVDPRTETVCGRAGNGAGPSVTDTTPSCTCTAALARCCWDAADDKIFHAVCQIWHALSFLVEIQFWSLYVSTLLLKTRSPLPMIVQYNKKTVL